jgi:hypothetical protein
MVVTVYRSLMYTLHLMLRGGGASQHGRCIPNASLDRQWPQEPPTARKRLHECMQEAALKPNLAPGSI